MPVQELSIPPGENVNITITALPTAVGALEDKVLCQVISSPELIEFGVTCMGAKPQVDLNVADCPSTLISGQQGSKKKAAPARDRSKSPAKGSRVGSKKPAGDENASADDPSTKQGPDAKRMTAKARRPSSTSLKARPGANQQQAVSTPPGQASSAALPRERGTPTRTGARPSSTRPRGAPSSGGPGASKKEVSIAEGAPTEGKAGTADSGPAAPATASKGGATAATGKAPDVAQPPAAKAAEAAKPPSTPAAAKGKKGGPAVPEPPTISLEADQSPLEGTAQVLPTPIYPEDL